jgi:hypothetical protein
LLCGAVDLEGIDAVQIIIAVIHRDLRFAITIDDLGFQVTDFYNWCCESLAIRSRLL